MITLTLILCLAGQPEQCEEVRPVEWRPTSLMACMMYGQHFAADWLRAQPAYAGHRLARWRCETGERT